MGGAEEQAMAAVKSLSEIEGVNASLTSCYTDERKDATPLGIDTLLHGVNLKALRALYRGVNFIRLYKYLRRKTCTLVFFNQIYLPLVFILTLGSRNVFFSIREYDHRLFSGWRLYVLKRASRLFTNTPSVAKKLDSIGVNSTLIPNAYRFSPSPSFNPACANKNRVLVVSNVEPHKAIHNVINALKSLPVEIVILGKCSNEAYLEYCKSLTFGGIADVIFKGFVDQEELSQYFLNSSVFVHPSEKEGVSNAILKAIDVGIPIVVSDIEENLSVVGDYASVFNVGDEDDLKAKVKLILAGVVMNQNSLRYFVSSKYQPDNYKKISEW